MQSTFWRIRAQADAGCEVVIVARKTPRPVDELQAETWKRSEDTDANVECKFAYQPQGWVRACRLRVFVTNFDGWTIAGVWGFYGKRAAVENPIEESRR